MFDFSNLNFSDFAGLAYTTDGPAATVTAAKLDSGHACTIDPAYDWDNNYKF